MNIVVTIFECHYLTSATDCDFIKVLVLNGLVGNPWLESWMQQILCSTPLCVLLRLTIVFWQDMFVQYMYFANALDIGVTSCFPVLQLYFFWWSRYIVYVDGLCCFHVQDKNLYFGVFELSMIWCSVFLVIFCIQFTINANNCYSGAVFYQNLDYWILIQLFF